MKKFLFLIALPFAIAVTSVAQLSAPSKTPVLKTNQDPIPEFMGIKVEGSMESLISAFKAKGFTLNEKTDTYLSMKGKMAGTTIDVDMAFTPKSKKCWKLLVYLPKQNNWYAIKRQFQEYKDVLVEKYGQPNSDYHFFISPYYEGDGYEMTAVAVDKCRYSSYWGNSMNIEISKFKQVRIGYENTINSDLLDKEKKEDGLKNF